MASSYFRQALSEVKPENKRFVQKNLEITTQILAILKRKGMTQRDLAERLGKKEAEVSRMLTGLQNLTLRTLTKVEAALEEDIVLTPLKAHEMLRTDGLKTAKVVSFKSTNIFHESQGHMQVSMKGSRSMRAYTRETGDVRRLNQLTSFERKPAKVS